MRCASPDANFFGMTDSRGIVLKLSSLFALDSFGGGFVIQAFCCLLVSRTLWCESGDPRPYFLCCECFCRHQRITRIHNALRKQLFDNLGSVGAAIRLNELPASALLKPGADPAQLLGLDSTAGLSANDLKNLLKLEAPLAVQAHPPHAGFFPLNKFSTVPLLVKAARTAFTDVNGDEEGVHGTSGHALKVAPNRANGFWHLACGWG